MFDIFAIGSWIQKHFRKRDVLILLGIVIVFFLTRIVKLDKFPIFTDEGIYIHWAKIAWKDSAWRFISLTDGKQPLHTWGMIPFLKIFHNNLLLGGRMYSVFTGFIALSGIFTLCYYLFGKRAAYIAAILYTATPMFMFYDRMALADSSVNAGFIWVLFGSILLAKTLRLDVALMYGVTAGFALLAKSSSQLFLGLSLLAPILTLHLKKKDYLKKVFNYYVLFAVAAVIAIVMYNIQRLSPYLHNVSEKNATFVMTFSQFIHEPTRVIFNNLPLVPYYVASEMAYITTLFGIIGLIWMYKKNRRLALYFTLWLLIPYIGISFFAIVLYPRYLIFFASLLTISAAFLLGKFKQSTVIILFGVVVLSVAYFDATIVADYAHIPFPGVDRGQYIESYNAGWGIKEIVNFARVKAADKPVIIIGEGNFGVIADMFESSISVGEPITVKGYWPLNVADLKANQSELLTHHVYVVFWHQDNSFKPGSEWPMTFIKKFTKPGNKDPYYLYELTQ